MGVAQVFVGKIFVHRLQTTKSMKILPLEITRYTVSLSASVNKERVKLIGFDGLTVSANNQLLHALCI